MKAEILQANPEELCLEQKWTHHLASCVIVLHLNETEKATEDIQLSATLAQVSWVCRGLKTRTCAETISKRAVVIVFIQRIANQYV